MSVVLFLPLQVQGEEHKRGIPNITYSDGQPPAIQVVHHKWKEQQQASQGFFSDSQQVKIHKTKGKLQQGTWERDMRKLKYWRQSEEQRGNRKSVTAVPQSTRLLTETPESHAHSFF